MSVRAALVFAMVLVTTAAHADPHVFYRAQNAATATMTLEQYRTPYLACKGTVGLLYAMGSTVAGATFDPVAGTCTAVLDDGTAAAVTVVSGAGSCPDDGVFDFEFQTCEALEGDAQLFGVAVASFFWICLIGGFLVGYRFGA